jgi:2-dehydro-3-deoxyphosphogluconate aldolase/(4S)-4-hydroxy-2-oxoglutarate aldolase
MSESIQQVIERVGLIPVLRARNAGQAHAVVQAMIAGGVTVVEVTMTVPGAVDVLKELKSEYGATLLLGAGTVTSIEQTEATIDAGAEFIVSPTFHPEVIERTHALGKISIPGALTPNEVLAAWEEGADYVKIFPCYLQSLLAPFPFLRLIPTGGVTLATAQGFFRAGARAVGVGSDLVNLAAIDQGTPKIITEAARAYLKLVSEIRKESQPVA